MQIPRRMKMKIGTQSDLNLHLDPLFTLDCGSRAFLELLKNCAFASLDMNTVKASL